MADYAGYFDFGSGPSLKAARSIRSGYGFSPSTYQYIDQGQQDQEAAAALNSKMEGLDSQSQQYIDQLKALANGYGDYANEFGTKAQPIIDALTGDISGLQGYIEKYGNTLNDVAPTLMNGIKVDPSATRTREQYSGNVLANFANARQKMLADAASQGQNPYANTGANRQMSLAQAASLTNADNQAYSDWRKQYNQDQQAKQQGMAQYAGLVGKQADMQGNVTNARAGLLGANESIFKAKASGLQAQQAGLSDLLSLQENRRQEALGLAQQGQNNARTRNDITQQLGAKLTSFDRAQAKRAGKI